VSSNAVPGFGTIFPVEGLWGTATLGILLSQAPVAGSIQLGGRGRRVFVDVVCGVGHGTGIFS